MSAFQLDQLALLAVAVGVSIWLVGSVLGFAARWVISVFAARAQK